MMMNGDSPIAVRLLVVDSVTSLPDHRFASRQPVFAHGDVRVRVLLPRSADELVDQTVFHAGERLPYWTNLWPAGKALARHLIDHPPPSRDLRIIELGCGAAALPSLALAMHGFDVLATDHDDDALVFAGINARRMAAGRKSPSTIRFRTALLDWRAPPADLGVFDLVIAADVMYERQNAIALAELVPRMLAIEGAVVGEGPGRMLLADERYLPEFLERMRQRGFCDREVGIIDEPPVDASRRTTRVRIIEFARLSGG
jgi:predicted nicotinamide N-methyase